MKPWDEKQGGQAGTPKDDAAQRHLRNVVAQEFQALCDKHDIGGAFFLVGKQACAWRFVLPKWSQLMFEGSNMRLRTKSSTQQERDDRDSTLFLIGMIGEMSGKCAVMFLEIFQNAQKAFGGSIEHTPFPGFGKDPFANVFPFEKGPKK